MERSLTIFVRDKTPVEIEKGIVKIFGTWGFTLASAEVEAKYPSHPEIFDLLREGVLPRAFLISPQEQSWCFVFPSYEVWLSEATDVCNLLSNEINCPVLLLLEDDSYGWGYFLYDNGEMINKFHTNPNSPSLHERKTKPPESFWMESTQLIGASFDEGHEYEGNPDVVAKTFNVQRDKIAHYLSVTGKYSGSTSHYEMADFIDKGLGIPKVWNSLYYYDIYHDEIENRDQWLNLILVRRIRSVELEWYKIYGEDFPGASPPLWLVE